MADNELIFKTMRVYKSKINILCKNIKKLHFNMGIATNLTNCHELTAKTAIMVTKAIVETPCVYIIEV